MAQASHVKRAIDLFSASTAETAKHALVFESLTPLQQKAIKVCPSSCPWSNDGAALTGAARLAPTNCIWCSSSQKVSRVYECTRAPCSKIELQFAAVANCCSLQRTHS